MRAISQKTYHALFFWGIFGKALISVGEILFGLVFALFNYDTLYRVAFMVFGGELTENPRDFIWEYIARGFQGFSATPRLVWAFIFLSHGIVKIFLLTGLWRNKSWAYPASIIAFSFFIIYQLYQMIFTPSILLAFITILDAIVVLLVIREYRHKKDIVWIV